MATMTTTLLMAELSDMLVVNPRRVLLLPEDWRYNGVGVRTEKAFSWRAADMCASGKQSLLIGVICMEMYDEARRLERKNPQEGVRKKNPHVRIPKLNSCRWTSQIFGSCLVTRHRVFTTPLLSA